MRSVGSVTKEKVIYREKGYACSTQSTKHGYPLQDNITKMNYKSVAAVTSNQSRIYFVLFKRRLMKSNNSVDKSVWHCKNGEHRVRDYFAF